MFVRDKRIFCAYSNTTALQQQQQWVEFAYALTPVLMHEHTRKQVIQRVRACESTSIQCAHALLLLLLPPLHAHSVLFFCKVMLYIRIHSPTSTACRSIRPSLSVVYTLLAAMTRLDFSASRTYDGAKSAVCRKAGRAVVWTLLRTWLLRETISFNAMEMYFCTPG